MKWEISKTFEFCYGHRVWVQELNQEYSLSSLCKCRFRHGHRGTVEVFMPTNQLNSQGMVTDFNHLSWFKKFIDDTIDHKFIADINDPLIPHWFGKYFDKNNFDSFKVFPEKYRKLNLELIKNEPSYIKEDYESYVIVDFVPTSENLSKWLCDIVSEKMSKIGVQISRVRFYETPSSQSTFNL